MVCACRCGGAQVNVGLRVLTRPDPERLPEIYRNLGTDYAERVLPSIIQVRGSCRRSDGLLGDHTRLPSAYTRPCQNLLVSSSTASAFLLLPQETLKSVVAQYNASQLLTMREVVSRDIRRILTQRARHFNIVLDDVSITNLTFSKEYTAAVESKQVAQQEAERAKFIVSSCAAHRPKACQHHQGPSSACPYPP